MSKSGNTEACEKFRIHSRRKICKECKQPKENHTLTEQDVRQIHKTLVSLADDCGAEKSKSNGTYSWIPPECPEDRLADYFRCFSREKVPEHNSEGFQWRLKQILKQIPETDISESACRFLEAESLPAFEAYIDEMKNKIIHFGFVKVWEKGMPLQCPTCLMLLENDELVVTPALVSAMVYHPACFICTECKDPLIDLIHCFEVDGKIYCIRHYSETQKQRCHACDELIFTSHYAQAKDAFYHRDHLRCFFCDDLILNSKGFENDGELYCVQCYEDMFSDDCQKCAKRIASDARQVTYEGKFWHYNCFTCESCGEIITDFENHDGKFYCVNCYNREFAPKCNGCKQAFEGQTKVVKYQDRTFHINCFKCADCKEVIGTGTFIPHGDLIYCKGCHVRNFGVRCFKCHYAITDDQGVTYNKQPYHADCFTCSKCQTQLGNQTFKNVEDNLYCVKCYGETFCKKCHSCNQPILIGEKDILYSYGDYKWHSECFTCRVCQSPLTDVSFIIRGNTLICKNCTSQEDTVSAAATSKKSDDRDINESNLKSSKEQIPAKSSSKTKTSQ
ncbi:four and a half LIM domains protein 1 [Nephila pilipes]|uniref:Four and a half LIM domains protein 1 n=1 Tax=Nephila pilipes TaxID=299642 RepID=A0A8X6QM92_NEPPI|nr:four and a half LIM domains protein 1 [Nephila pilipes]